MTSGEKKEQKENTHRKQNEEDDVKKKKSAQFHVFSDRYIHGLLNLYFSLPHSTPNRYLFSRLVEFFGNVHVNPVFTFSHA